MTLTTIIQLGILVTTATATLIAAVRVIVTASLVIESRLIRLETIVLRSKEFDDHD